MDQYQERFQDAGSTTRTFLAFVGGLAAGYAAALLLAPRSGREMRRMLGEYASTTGERLSTMARDAMQSARETAQTAAEKGGEYAEQAASRAKSATRSGPTMPQ